MTHYIKLAVVVFLTAFVLKAHGQEKKDIETILSSKQLQKYRKGDALIDKGIALIVHSDSITRKVTKKLKRETDLKHEQANLLLHDGYLLKMKALKDKTNELKGGEDINTDISGRLDRVKEQLEAGIKGSRKTFGHYRKTPDLKRSLKYQNKGIEQQKKVLLDAEKELVDITSLLAAKRSDAGDEDVKEVVEEEITKTEPVEEPVEEIVENKVEEEVVLPVTEAVKEEEIIEEKVISELKKEPLPQPEVYFTIQIMADKVRVTEDRLKRVYSGNREIIEHMADGWFRYSAGRFKTYSDAVSAMRSEGIKGYIVAYNGDERISVAAAKKMSGGNK